MSSEQVFSIKTRKPVDEESLLTEEDKASKTANKSEEDCTTRPTACKNCTCGRAEVERKALAEGLDTTDFKPPEGGCGNCARGDAFRCAGCPFRGKPGWDASSGQVKLNLMDDV
eukprot:GILI01018157.1.p1 GENE.GILI01018157.1~~GILI01018157.1.p1  ORF type:complete len:131 (+),score=40.81 GILI01018157.1:52-393(+)